MEGGITMRDNGGYAIPGNRVFVTSKDIFKKRKRSAQCKAIEDFVSTHDLIFTGEEKNGHAGYKIVEKSTGKIIEEGFTCGHE